MLRFALLFMFLCACLPALAQDSSGDDPYTVTGITVDVKGANGSEARDKAFTDGGRLALAAVAAKLSGAKQPDFKAVDNNTITRLIKSFEVETEKASGTRYIGTLTYHFKPAKTDAFLSSHGMAVRDQAEITTAAIASAPPAQRVIVLPIVRTGDRSVLFEEQTDWMRAWQNYLSDHPNATVALPAGEMEDISTISAAEALGGVPGPLVKIMQRYETQSVLVAVLSAPSFTATATERDVNVQLAIFDKTGMMKNTSSFNLAAAPQTKAMPWLQEGAGTALAKWQGVADKITSASTAPGPAHDMAMTPNGQLQLAMTIPFATPEQWQSIRARLQEINGVTRFDVVSLSHARAQALITYQGNRRSFENALAEKGLRLDQTMPNTPPTLVALGGSMGGGVIQQKPLPAMAAPPASTFRTVYPAPPTPKDEVIYADPDGDMSKNNGDDSDDTAPPGDASGARVAPPPVTSKKTPASPAQDIPPLIP